MSGRPVALTRHQVGGLESERDEVHGTEKLPRWRNVLVTAQDVVRVIARLQRLKARE
jgi:hypothetical protein